MTARVHGRKYDGGDPHGIVHSPDELDEHASAVLLAKDIANYLEHTYPGWAWAVETDPRGGIVNLRALKLSGEWGYILKLAWIQDDPVVRRRLVLKAAGEILERYGMPRAGYSYEAWKAGPRDIAGNPKPDLSDKSLKTRRRYRDEALTTAVKNGAVLLKVQDTPTATGTHRRILLAGGYRTREEQATDVRD